MTNLMFDALSRGTESRQGRRHTLKALGAATLATVAGAPLVADARKKKRKKRKKENRPVCPECPAQDCTAQSQQAAAARCQSQIAPCEREVRELCRNNFDPEFEQQCLTDFLPCCQPLGACDVSAFFACIEPESEPED